MIQDVDAQVLKHDRDVRGVRQDLRRLRGAMMALRNWPRFVSAVVMNRLGRGPAEIEAVTRAGNRIRCHNDVDSRDPVLQMFADDDYDLKALAGEYGNLPIHVVDIGAHVGAFAIAVCERLPSAHVTSYEPSPSSFRYLAANVATNGLTSRVHAVNAAVSPAPGEVTFFESPDASCLSTTVAALVPAEARPMTVTSVGLEHVLEQEGFVDVLKIDCEGAEYGIVRALPATDWGRVGRVLIEYHPVPNESWAALRSHFASVGFQPLWDHPIASDLGLAALQRIDHGP